MEVAVVVNPIAGLGGLAGLHGSDGLALAPAPRDGECAEGRAIRALSIAATLAPGARLRCGPGALGCDAVRAAGFFADPVGGFALSGTSRDTIESVRRFGRPALLVVAGGDGTLRDALSVLPAGVPVLGIPCGSKMQSGVFARSPEAAGRMIGTILAQACLPPLRTAEVADLDEEALRRGIIAPRVWGEALVPALPEVVTAKGRAGRDDAADVALAAAEALADFPPGALAVLGPGMAAKAVGRAAGIHLPPLGVDALVDGRLAGRGLSRQALSALVAAHRGPVRLVLGVIGRQGVLLGRGNREIGPEVLRRAGREGLVVIASAAKLATLAPPVLTVDSGDPGADAGLAGFLRVRTGPGRETLLRVVPG